MTSQLSIHIRCPRWLRPVWIMLGFIFLGFHSPGYAQEQPEELQDFLSNNCTGCHDPGSKEGDLDLESLPLLLEDPDNFHLWERVHDRVREGEMPPEEALDEEEASAFLASVQEILKSSDESRIAKGGRVQARRLTRSQYEREVCDLLKVDIPLSEYLPADSLTDGFDTVSKSQQISDHSMAAYLQAADAALDAAFASLLNDIPRSSVRLDWRDLRRDEERTNREPEGRPLQKDIVSWSSSQNFYGRMHATTVSESGRYRIRMRVEGVNLPEDSNIWCSVKSGVCYAKASTLYWIGSFEATDKTEVHEFDAWIKSGHQLQIRPNDRGLRRVAARQIGEPAGTLEPLGIPGVAITWIELERLNADREEVRRALIGKLKLRPVEKDDSPAQTATNQKYEIVSEEPESDLRNLIQSFAIRAFRRPVQHAELKPYFSFASEHLHEEGSMQDALRAAYRAILCSSRFLYFEEAPGELDGHALANRLSHFLWGTAPDQELRKLAAAGGLRDAGALRQQTDRMLDDARSNTFISDFSDQWLMLYELDSTTPDGKLYPEYDDILHHSLPEETHAFVRELIDKDLPVTNIVDSDFTFLNSRLARHYDIAWPGGTGMHRVAIDQDSRRGGIITHASILKVTANGTTTSPIIRGVWMLERIMGQHVPPPPANVPAVEPDIRGATSIRDQLDKHRKLDSCAACHIKIDPPGFALESYDVIGGWRDRYRAASTGDQKRWVDGLPVDPSHRFASGETFESIDGLQEILAAHPDTLARNLAAHLVTYATGASPTFADREDLDAIVRETERSEHGVRSIVHEVVLSPMFTSK